MGRWCVLVSFVAILATGSQAWSEGNEKKPADAKRIGELVQQLGSLKFLERESARRELEAIGAPALPALKKAAKSQDLETSRRASEIVRQLEEKNNTAKILAPRRVRLKLKDTPILEAVKELEKQSQVPILIQGDQAALAKRKVTLDTGDTTFWEALDQLCAKGGLVEISGQNIAQPFPQPFPGVLPPRIKIQPLPLPGVLPVIPPKVDPKEKGPVFRLEAKPAVAASVIAVDPPKVAPPQPAQPPVQGQAGQGQAGKGQAVQGKPVQILPVQIKPVQIDPIQVFPGGGIRPFPGNTNPNQVILAPGEPKKVPTCYSGAVRVRLLPGVGNQPGVAGFLLDVLAEPRLQNFTLVGTPRIDKAIDDQGQSLMMAMEPMPPQPVNGPFNARDITRIGMLQGINRQAPIRLKLGEKAAKSLKELKGSFTASALMPPEPLISVDKVLKSAGKTVKGLAGGAINVKAIDKMDNGDYQLQISMENMPVGNNPFGGIGIGMQIQIRGGGNVMINGFPAANNNNMPILVDGKGQSFQLVNIPQRGLQINNGVVRQDVTLVFRPNNGQGEPARLVLNGQRTVNFQVPFSFTNVPLP